VLAESLNAVVEGVDHQQVVIMVERQARRAV